MTETTTKRALDVSTSADSLETTGEQTPADALGVTKRMSTENADRQESYECPSCGRDFETDRGLKSHHVQTHGESIAGEEVSCDNCGNELTRTPSKAKKADRFFCDAQCRGEWRSENYTGENNPSWSGGKVECTCDNCGDSFERGRSYLKGRSYSFCSTDCMGEFRSDRYSGEKNPASKEKKTYHCAHCGTKIKRLKSQTKRYDKIFCGRGCLSGWASENRSGENSPHWKGGYEHYYGPNWYTQRRKARERDGHTCQVCGHSPKPDERNLDVHHIRPFRTFDGPEQANALDNLVTLCRPCHRQWEGIPLSPQTD